MSTPLVSVNLCVYNCAPYLRETLDSILAQDYPSWELIMVDDGSTDGSLAIMEEYQQSLPDKIRLIINDGNLGLTVSRNKCVAASKGQYIAIHDGDDISRPDRLSRQVAFFETDRAEDYVLCGSWAYFFGEGLPTVTYMNPVHFVREFMIENCSFVMTSLMIRRRFMEEQGIAFDETLSIGEDYDFEFRMLNVAGAVRKGYNIPEPLISYRLRNNSMSKGKNHELTVAFSRSMRLRHFRLLLGRPLTDKEEELIEAIFLTYKYETRPTAQDIRRFWQFCAYCQAENERIKYFDPEGLRQFFAVVVARLYFRQRKISLASFFWLIRAGIVRHYTRQFSLKDLLYMVKSHLKEQPKTPTS